MDSFASHTRASAAEADGTSLREHVESFVAQRVMPEETLLEAGGAAASAVRSALAEAAKAAGLWALPLPIELGGQGLPFAEYVCLAEVEGASDYGPAVLGSASLLDVRMLQGHAGDRVRETYLERLASGELHAAFAMTEPDTPGTDPTLTASRATTAPDGSWILSGRKWFVSGAQDADVITVLARTDGQTSDREGLSLLLVPTDAPGFRLVRELPILGAGGQWEIAMDEVRLPKDHLIGERGRALPIARQRLQLGRTLRCLRWLGQAQRAYDLMCERARTRSQSSGALAERQLVQQHIFESLLAIRSTRPLVHKAAALLDAGHDARVESGLAKVAAARTLQQVADSAVQVYGAAGLGPDTALPGLLRMGRMARLLDGPDELHIASVAGSVLR
ncbi:acyl-CoA dehydrogenase family protein [Nocardia amamiensis]|uniref:acyl-CoA dehydrogenase family protein n=1 Tax=Nocardia amamiensis TaxID=404578 RepID=UPI00082F5E06|nr:acyl-CoA dehydrogenase family protein [Nocardia amamiensis]